MDMTINSVEESMAMEFQSEELWMDNIESIEVISTRNNGLFDLRNLILNAREMIAPESNAKDIQWDLNLGEPIFLRSTYSELSCVVTHVLSNAILYNRISGSVRVLLKGDSDYCNIIIEDTGEGIDQEKVPDVFSVRLKRSNPGCSGITMGLSICRDLIESMNGRIEVKSTPGTGTRVTITLPIII